MYLAVAPVIPIVCRRYGLRACVRFPTKILITYSIPQLMLSQYFIGAAFLILSSWVRFAGTAKSLDASGAYALLVLGQVREPERSYVNIN